MNEEIPRTPLNSTTIDVGWLPCLGVRRRGPSVAFRTSRSVYVLSLLALAIGIMLCAMDVGFLWVFAPPLIAGAIVAPVVVPWINRKFATGFEVHLAERTVTISCCNTSRVLSFDRIVALQQLDAPGGSSQVNLVFLNEDGELDRACIYASALRCYAYRIAKEAARHVPWPVLGPDGERLA